jgi:hypothetical protein
MTFETNADVIFLLAKELKLKSKDYKVAKNKIKHCIDFDTIKFDITRKINA